VSRHLQELLAGLDRIEAAAAFDVVVLSDSHAPDAIAAERFAVAELRARQGSTRLLYRRRRRNTGRKAGNLGEWCRRHGGAYEFMVVLDADSQMSADTLVRLALAMEDHPDAGLMQTVPTLLPGRTFFGRMQAFSAALHAPVIGRGLAFWHGPSSNYWGHNAILRVAAFCATARLPRLRGRAPLGGEILSHDFVEAALLRRSGWKVYLLPGLAGTREDAPQTLLDYALRDRRWCQGNLQHARVLPARGLVAMSRLHLLTGIMSYAAAPCWMAMLVLGAVLLPSAADPQAGGWVSAGLLGGLVALLLGTRLCGLLSLCARPELRGRWPRVTLSAVLETLLVALLAPVHMVTHTLALWQILVLRRDAGWQAQRRGDGMPALRAQCAGYLPHMLVALIGGSLFLALGALTPWLAPVFGVLLLAPGIAVWLSSLRAGTLAARLRWFELPQTALDALPSLPRPAEREPDPVHLPPPALAPPPRAVALRRLG
jgi:membrane glycosyltransferase